MSKTFKKTLAGFAVAALLLVGAGTAKAATIAELQALIADLTAQLSALSGGSSSCMTYNHTVTLMVGSKGSQVMAMQGVVGATADGNFGPMTKAKVQAFQSSKGLTADGVVGAMTGAALHTASMNCAGNPSNPSNPSNGELEGDFGTIDDVNELSQYNNEDVGEGEEDVTVLGFEVEASNDGDISIESVRVSFNTSGNSGSDNLDDYIESVSIWMGDEMVGEADVEDFSESNNLYTKTIALDDSIVRAEETEEFYVAVNAVSNLDSGDISGDNVIVDVENLRFEDGSGVVTTESGFDLGSMNVPMDFVTFSQSADTELKIRKESDSPEAGIVVVDNSDNTDDVVLLKGTLELEGESDATFESIPVTFETSGGTNIDGLTGSVTLVLDGEEYTESVTSSLGTAASITFDNLDFDLGAGDEVEFEVRADINDIEDGSFDAGDMLKASITSTNRNNMDVENEEGDQLSDSTEKSGTATGEYQEFRTNGIMVELVSTEADSSDDTGANNDTGTFKIKFKVTAIGDDVYLATSAPATNYAYSVDVAGTATSTGVSAVIANNTDTDVTSQGNYLVEEGESETLTLTVSKTNTAAYQVGLTRVSLTGIKWDTSDADTSMANTYSSNLEEFRTDYISLN